MGFELFTEGGKRGFKPSVKIRANGQIYFNLGAMRKFSLEEFVGAQLYFDNDSERIGVVFTKYREAEGALNLVVRPKTSSSWISAKSFFHYYGITLPEDQSIDVEWEMDENNMLILNYPGKAIIHSGPPPAMDDDDLPF